MTEHAVFRKLWLSSQKAACIREKRPLMKVEVLAKTSTKGALNSMKKNVGFILLAIGSLKEFYLGF